MGLLRRVICTLAPLTAALALPATGAAQIEIPAGAALPPGTSPAVWLCKPGLATSACATRLSTTVFDASGKKRLRTEKLRLTDPKKIDCFYVYPTVSDQPTPNANLTIDPQQKSIAEYQAARYSQYCRVYAPMYRQLTLSAINGAPIPGNAREIAYSDVRSAFLEYLKKDNKGRGFVLIGHSQGTFMLRELIKREVDKKASVRRRLVSAILLGGNVTVKKGSDRGGDFTNVRACRRSGQTGCVVAFSTFSQTPPADAIFGRTPVSGQEVLCTNPAALAGGSARLTPIYPSAPFAPGSTISLGIGLLGIPQPKVSTVYLSAPGAYSGRCSTAGGADVLKITARGGAILPKFSPTPQWGLHLVDANIALGNLLDLVAAQEKAYLRKAAARA